MPGHFQTSGRLLALFCQPLLVEAARDVYVVEAHRRAHCKQADVAFVVLGVFRSQDELAKVQETILKLVGVGLEMRCQRDVDEGIRLLMEASPVDLFRVAYTRVSKLRQAWKLLLQDHRVELLISRKEYECLDELSCQRLAEMSIFSETEIETIKSLTLGDELFSSLGVVTERG